MMVVAFAQLVFSSASCASLAFTRAYMAATMLLSVLVAGGGSSGTVVSGW